MRPKERVFQENLKFFHSFAQFNPPYHVLLDGSFICSLLANGVENATQYFEKYFKGKCRLLYTSCIHFHLECEFPNNESINTVIAILREYPCSHKFSSPVSSSSCILSIASRNQFKRVIGPPRKKHYVKPEDPRVIVATQNMGLLEDMRKIVAVNLIYFESGVIKLEKPSYMTLKWAEGKMLNKMEMLELRKEIFLHALEEPGETPVNKNCESSKQVSNETCHVGSMKANTNKNLGKKRKRDTSPDICDFSEKAFTTNDKMGMGLGPKSFEKYKTLCPETKTKVQREEGGSRSRRN